MFKKIRALPNKEKETNIALNVPRETVGSSTLKEQWLQYAQNHINVTQEFWEFCSYWNFSAYGWWKKNESHDENTIHVE